MKKENVIIVIIGLFLFSYVLDAVVNPLDLDLPTPYHYLHSKYLTVYPFTTASIIIRAIGIFLTPLLLLSFTEGHYTAKGAILLVLISLMQLYALQDLATGAAVVPLEWALSISLSGLALGFPAIWYFFVGGLSWLHKSLGGKDASSEDNTEEVSED
jgi:hypothetical protein